MSTPIEDRYKMTTHNDSPRGRYPMELPSKPAEMTVKITVL